MKKMIGVINDNLRSVVNGIKEHRETTENNLSVVKNEIDEKVVTASKYKEDVEAARNSIISLETEISELESDLKELNDKFGSKNFKEILAAGDKEINTKITEKKVAISEQNSIIDDITKKAHQLKKELTKLKDKKNAIEEDLNKTLILEGYYEKRINAIIDFSVEHPGDLATYKEIDEVEDLSTEEIEDIDINNIIDGQVFNEIDSISNGTDVDIDNIDEALDEEQDEDEDSSESGDDLSKLDEILNTASEIIENNENMVEEESDVEEPQIKKTIEIEDLTEDVVLNAQSDDDEEQDEDNAEDKEDAEISESDRETHIHLHEMSEPITVNLENLDDNFNSQVQSEILFSNDNGFSDSNLAKCGLIKENFDPNDLELLKPLFDRENTLEFIEVLKKHGYDESKIYNSVGVLLYVTPQNLDKMLTMLESVASKDDINYVFRYLDKVNISKLEQNIQTSNESSLTELLITALNEEKEADLVNLLSISAKDVNYIKKNLADDYKLMVNFPEIVLSNYNTLKGYEIDNLNECIIKHPHRFTYNPSRFAAILDKYDVEDLVRCINKNAAVIDKL